MIIISKKDIDRLIDYLERVSEYMENRADCEQRGEDLEYSPNEEMTLQTEADDLIKLLKRIKYDPR